MAQELLEEHSTQEMLPVLLKFAFADKLNVESYVEIEDATRIVDHKGKTRLFVTQGKRDGLSRNKLIKMIEETCQIKASKIKDIQMLDKFSFITLPFHEAEILLSYFKKRKKGKGPFITKAKKERNERSGRRRRTDRT